MKPGQPPNALKSFDRTSKCFKILWPGFESIKMLGPKARERNGSGSAGQIPQDFLGFSNVAHALHNFIASRKLL